MEEQTGSMGINPGKAANSGQLWLFFSIFLSWVEQATRPNSIGNQGQLEEKSQMAVFFLVFLNGHLTNQIKLATAVTRAGN